MTRKSIKVGINGVGRSGTSRDSNPAGLYSSSTHLGQCESNEPNCLLDPNLGPGTDARLKKKIDGYFKWQTEDMRWSEHGHAEET